MRHSEIQAARQARQAWSATPLDHRLTLIRRLRHRIADDPSALVAAADVPWRASRTETLTAEILPLLDACRFLEREARKLLAPRSLGSRRRPLWLYGSHVEIRREPVGLVLVIGPANYPILLPGVQAIQALVAGNAVVVKPGRGGAPAMRRLAQELTSVGLLEGLFGVLDESVEAATNAIDDGVDKVVLTGSFDTGREVLHRLADHGTPSVVELSGCDAVLVQESADIDLVTRALAFGITLNAGYTCIAPRRVFVHRHRLPELEARMIAMLGDRPPLTAPAEAIARLLPLLDDAIDRGARFACGARPTAGRCTPLLLCDVPADAPILEADLAVPLSILIPVTDDDEAVRQIGACPFRLGATVFGDEAGARSLARRLDVGIVVVNDMIVPTADPRIPFGGRGRSGFGLTRGASGLLELTASKTVVSRRGRFRPHFDPTSAADIPMFESFIRASHGSSVGSRVRAMLRLMREGRRKSQRGGGTS